MKRYTTVVCGSGTGIFFPVQMCHMRINEKYRVWHGACHLDDALMAPVNLNHFDGYLRDLQHLQNINPERCSRT